MTSCERRKISCIPVVLDACHSFKNGNSDISDGFKGAELAQAMGCTSSVACNKLNPDNEHNVPTLTDAVKLTDHFDDDRILESWADERGYLLVEKINPDEIDEEELLDQVLNLSSCFGDLNGSYHAARADGVISPEEYQSIKAASILLQRAAATFENILQTQVRELPEPKGALIDV